MSASLPSALPDELRELVRESAALLGQVIQRESGKELYDQIEALRENMADTRDQSAEKVVAELRRQFPPLEKLSAQDRHTVARAFTFFLELMNACENAYRTFRLKIKPSTGALKQKPDALVYVLTAHPTEARSPENIEVFRGLQRILLGALEKPESRWKQKLLHQLEVAWRLSPVRVRAPKVRDEADHIYNSALRPEVLSSLLSASQETLPVYLRTWVGGDKDGHPGVDEKVMQESLQIARQYLLRFAFLRLADIDATLDLVKAKSLVVARKNFRRALSPLRRLGDGDGRKVKRARQALTSFAEKYVAEIGAPHPALEELKGLFHVFPGLVVPLELREASDLITQKNKNLAIDRMLRALGKISRGGEARWYARGLIVSMTENVDQLAAAATRMRAALGSVRLPVIPLFETNESLAKAPTIVEEMIDHFAPVLDDHWARRIEVMVGYSDSSKQGGVFPSRLAIAAAMHKIESVCEAKRVIPIFFQGSGGSVDRGGGTVQDQVAWWPRSALRTYKVTIQGEMVDRTFSSAEINRGQVERITRSAGEVLSKKPVAPSSAALFEFARKVTDLYRTTIRDPRFLDLVAKATPYPFLSELKFGSRPSRRTTEVSVDGLRAIPWVLCWTQTRVLFQTWWGVGSAWENTDERDRLRLKEDFAREPVFTSFIKALGFTLAKVELPVWKIYLEKAGMGDSDFYSLFEKEFRGALAMVRFVSGEENLLWFQPWLGASIRLRSPMIHPLNLLQILSVQEKDFALFRTTATGISAGMMTTG